MAGDWAGSRLCREPDHQGQAVSVDGDLIREGLNARLVDGKGPQAGQVLVNIDHLQLLFELGDDARREIPDFVLDPAAGAVEPAHQAVVDPFLGHAEALGGDAGGGRDRVVVGRNLEAGVIEPEAEFSGFDIRSHVQAEPDGAVLADVDADRAGLGGVPIAIDIGGSDGHHHVADAELDTEAAGLEALNVNAFELAGVAEPGELDGE